MVGLQSLTSIACELLKAELFIVHPETATLLAVSIAKVFLFDMSQLSQGFRILSFLGLGALLLAISFVYQRDWLNLRGQEDRK